MKGGFRSLNEILSFRGGGTPRKDVPEYWSDEIPWASVKDFKSLDLAKTQDSISRKGLEASASNLIPAGHVIIPTRMALGKAAINSIDMAINQDLRALIPKVPLDSRYLLHAMIGLADEIVRYGSGATVKGITQENLGKLQIPLPPLAEQKRIAAILDAADALRAKRREALAQLDALLQSTFLTLFGDPVENPMGWPVVTIGDLLSSTAYGTSTKAHEEKRGFPCLRMNNITYAGGWDFRSLKYVDLKPKEVSKNTVHRGQILFNRTNSKELVGKTAVYRRDEPMAFAGYLVRGITNAEADAEYISAFLNLPQGKAILQGMCKSIVGMANINAQEFKSISLPKPPIALQQRFAAVVKSVEHQKAAQRGHLTELDALFAALQHRAFRGEL